MALIFYPKVLFRPFHSARQPCEHAFHRVDLREITADVVIAAPVAGGQPKAALGVDITRPGAAQVDHAGQIMLLLERRGVDAPALQRIGDAAVQVGGRQLDRMGRHNARIETIEPARSQIVPGPVLDHNMVMNTVASRLSERRIGKLIHANRA